MKPSERKPFGIPSDMARNFTAGQILSIFPKLQEAIKLQLEFEKNLAGIAALTGDVNKKPMELVNWYRNEYIQRPEQYPGDNVPVDMLKNRIAFTAETLDAAIEFVRGELEKELQELDEQRRLRAGLIYIRNLNID